MRHRVLLVGGTAVERGRLEGSLRNGGVSAMQAADVTSATLLCRQFGPSAVLLLDEPWAAVGRAHIAMLSSHPSTATTPLVLIQPPQLDQAMALLLHAVALVPSGISGVELVATLDRVFGEDPRDLRRRPAFHRRGPATLRRLGDHLRLQRGSGVITVTHPGGPAWVRVDRGLLLDAVVGDRRGAEAIKALLSETTDEPWALSFVDAVAAPAPMIVLDTPVETPSTPQVSGIPDEPLPTTLEAELPVDVDLDGLEVALDDGDDLIPDLGLPPLPGHHDAPPRLTILLVDDDPALIMLYGRTLGHSGHTIHTAADGEEGYLLARRLRPDVIVSDIAMPKKNGWDLLAAVRNDPRLAQTPFLLLSCHGDFLRGLSNARAGADDYIEKGIRAAALKERVEAAGASRARLTTWQTQPPPSFRERLAGLGLFGLMQTLERTRADGEVVLDDGWTKVHLWLVGGHLVLAEAVEPDGTRREGIEALVAALWPEADVEFRAGEAPPAGRAMPETMALSPLAALEEAVCVVEERRRASNERALSERAALRFREAPTTLFLAVADKERASVVKRLQAGAAPRDLLEGGEVDPLLIEWVVQEVIAKGLATVA